MMVSPKLTHEVRCPIHGLIRFTNLERDLINTPAMQRLKYVHQLAMTYQVYPGACHRRFEHSIGVMDLAGRAFDSLLQREKYPYGAERLSEAMEDAERKYWRQALRLAALLHDVGHLPFSHAAEEELLPPGIRHEDLTKRIILDSEVSETLKAATPPIRPIDVVKLAVKPKHQRENKLTQWEIILNEILNGDTFGVDRIDYLLRDSHHAGVAYGRFDPLRLLDSLVIARSLPGAKANGPLGETPGTPESPGMAAPISTVDADLTVGILDGGIQGAEALLLARYFMYSQVYLHPVRRAYDIHLKDFMIAWLGKDGYPTDPAAHVRTTDNEVMTALSAAARDEDKPGHAPARRIVQRDHFRKALSIPRADLEMTASGPVVSPAHLQKSLSERFGVERVRVDCIPPARANKQDVLLVRGDGSIRSGLDESEVLRHIPQDWCAYIFADRGIPAEEVQRCYSANKDSMTKDSG